MKLQSFSALGLLLGLAMPLIGADDCESPSEDIAIDQAGVKFVETYPNARLGGRVGSAGDVFGDGRECWWAGAHGYLNFRGRVYVVCDEDDGTTYIEEAASLTVTGPIQDEGGAYASQASFGDFNRDGYVDMAISAYGANNPETGELAVGGVFVFNGPLVEGEDLTLSDADYARYGEHTGDSFGFSLATWYRDSMDAPLLVAGAPGWDAEPSFTPTPSFRGFDVRGDLHQNQWRLAVDPDPVDLAENLGAITVMGSDLSVIDVITGPNPGGRFGYKLASAGDVVNNGVPELLVSEPGPYDGTGFVYLFTRQAYDGTANYRAHATFEVDDGTVGSSLSGGYDLTGDGRGDLLFGVEDYHNTGLIVIYSGADLFELNTLDDAFMVIEGDFDTYNVGKSVAVGDSNGDGRGDLLFGGSGSTDDTPRVSGAAFLLVGPAPQGVWPLEELRSGDYVSRYYGTSEEQDVGWSVGFVEKPGYDDILVGAFTDSTYSMDAGAVYRIEGGL